MFVLSVNNPWMNVSAVRNEGMYASWIRGNSIVLYVNQNQRTKQKMSTSKKDIHRCFRFLLNLV